jgi:endo-1,4-beta-xylanase
MVKGASMPLPVIALSLCFALLGAVELPPGGSPALPEEPQWMGHGAAISVDGPGFRAAHRVTSTQRTEYYKVQHGAALAVPVAKGDVLLLQFWARCVESMDETGTGLIYAYLQKNGPPHDKPLLQVASVGADWTEFRFGGRAGADYPAQGMALQFGLGSTEQTIEIGGIEVLNYGDRVALEDLPVIRPTYPGREADAAWRGPAAERIRDLRTAPLRLRVLDATGESVAGVPVRATLRRHAFPFGSALTARHLTGDSEDAARYRAKARELFNAGTLENGLKWGAWHGDWGSERFGREKAIAALRWCQEQAIAMRGHVFVWPGRRHLPRHVQALLDAKDAAGVHAACLAHIDDLAVATRGLVQEWDVVNEPYTNYDVMDLCGQQVLVEYFQRARQHLPGIPLALNDYGILTTQVDSGHQQHFEDSLRFLIEQDAPIDVIGMQGHFGTVPTGPERVLAVLDRFAALGLKIRITEFDINTDDQVLQADYTRDFMTAVFSHPAVIGFQIWGFWAGAHWRDRAAMYDLDWTERPNGTAYRELLFKTWHSDETLTTAADGTAELRGFLGDYAITVGDHTSTATLTKDSGTITIQLP